MSRRRSAVRRIIAPDPRFGSVQVSRLINKVMTRGKKSTAQRIVYEALEQVQRETHRSGQTVLEQALINVTPSLEVKPRRVGGATYQVPIEVRTVRRQSLAFRWLVGAARARTGKPMAERLAQEVLEASRGQGAAAKRKGDLHRMAEANRAFVHYRW